MTKIEIITILKELHTEIADAINNYSARELIPPHLVRQVDGLANAIVLLEEEQMVLQADWKGSNHFELTAGTDDRY